MDVPEDKILQGTILQAASKPESIEEAAVGNRKSGV